MLSSILIARFLGLYLLIVGSGLLIRRMQFPRVAHSLSENEGVVFVLGILALIFGLVIVLAHNVWAWNWALPITLIGYLAIFKGIARLWFPDYIHRTVDQRITTQSVILMAIFAMLLGVYFLHHGFLAQH